jgi:FkbM family methyltransferase
MSHTVARWLTALVTAATAWQTPMRQSNTLLRIAGALHRRHTVATDAGPITFLSTHPQALDYPAKLMTREPETIAWLGTLDERAVLWDIGANIGAYSLYAARRGARVWAFEPAPASFAALSDNIRVNSLDGKIAALPIGLGGARGVHWLHMSTTNPGSVSHTLSADSHGTSEFRQAALSYDVDGFRRDFSLPQPTHIKLDVDGIEADILAGAAETLGAPSLRSLLVEIDFVDSPSNARIYGYAASAGLALTHRGGNDGYGHCNAIFARA